MIDVSTATNPAPLEVICVLGLNGDIALSMYIRTTVATERLAGPVGRNFGNICCLSMVLIKPYTPKIFPFIVLSLEPKSRHYWRRINVPSVAMMALTRPEATGGKV